MPYLKPIYLEARNEIIEPREITVVTLYFMKKWALRLGPTLALLIKKYAREEGIEL
jgi:hypothetical protein